MPKNGIVLNKYGNCGGCGKLISDKAKSLCKCIDDMCPIWWHVGCAKRKAHYNNDANWKCPNCLQVERLFHSQALNNINNLNVSDSVVNAVTHDENLDGEVRTNGVQDNTPDNVEEIQLPNQVEELTPRRGDVLDNSSQPSQSSQVSQGDVIPQQEDLPSLEIVHRTHVPTFTWIPKAARAEFSRVYSTQCSRVSANPENIVVWTLLLMFIKCILPAAKGRPDTIQSKVVKDRLARWKRGEFNSLWDEAVRNSHRNGKSKKKATKNQDVSQEEKNAVRATRLAQQGEYTRAAQALISGGLAETNSSTVRNMQNKHPLPQQPRTFQPADLDLQQISFSQSDVVKAIKSFKKGTAPGPDGLRAEHLKVLRKNNVPNREDKVIGSITDLVNCMAAGKVPDVVAPFLCGATLHAGLKKDGGIRPIAVGNILRRLTSKCIMFNISSRASGLLGPHQLGVGVRGGLEAIIHSVKYLNNNMMEDTMILQVDLTNAFNCCDRDAAFHEVEKHFPECMKWVLTCYNNDAELNFGNSVILSRTGFHQGDPLASLLFSLTLQPLVEQIKQEAPALKLNEWYLDDGVIGGKKEELQIAVDILLDQGPRRGLFLSRLKSSVWSSAVSLTQDPLERQIPAINDEGIVVLGSPVGSKAFEKRILEERIEKAKLICDKLPLLQDPQVEYTLLRSCLSLPKLMFNLRTTYSLDHMDLWISFDEIMRECLGRILGTPLLDQQWQQAQLPVSLGGLGLRAAVDHAPAAYVCSLVASQDLKESILDMSSEECPLFIPEDLLKHLSESLGEDISLISVRTQTQREISLKLDLRNHQLLSNNFQGQGVTREIARLASLGLPHAGDWLNVVPSPSLGLQMRQSEFIMSVKYRLGCDVYPFTGKCTACPNVSDIKGDHAISCGYEGERIARHDHLRNALFSTCVQACLGPSREDRALIPGSNNKPADLLIPSWTGGKDTAIDITVVNPLQVTLLDRAADTPGHALTHRYNEKMAKHGAACSGAGLAFIPMPVETLGGWHDQSVLQVKKIGSALARHTGQEDSVTINHLFQRLSVLLAKGNAALLLNRIPLFSQSEVNGAE